MCNIWINIEVYPEYSSKCESNETKLGTYLHPPARIVFQWYYSKKE